MIYYCDKCRFLFSRSGEVDACVDCGSPNIHQANEEQVEEYKKRLGQADKLWESDD